MKESIFIHDYRMLYKTKRVVKSRASQVNEGKCIQEVMVEAKVHERDRACRGEVDGGQKAKTVLLDCGLEHLVFGLKARI